VHGAAPLFFLDYLANNGLSEDQKVAIVEGMAEACREAGCSLIGGETAAMPGVLHGMQSYLLQYEWGQILEAKSIYGDNP